MVLLGKHEHSLPPYPPMLENVLGINFSRLCTTFLHVRSEGAKVSILQQWGLLPPDRICDRCRVNHIRARLTIRSYDPDDYFLRSAHIPPPQQPPLYVYQCTTTSCYSTPLEGTVFDEYQINFNAFLTIVYNFAINQYSMEWLRNEARMDDESSVEEETIRNIIEFLRSLCSDPVYGSTLGEKRTRRRMGYNFFFYLLVMIQYKYNVKKEEEEKELEKRE